MQDKKLELTTEFTKQIKYQPENDMQVINLWSQVNQITYLQCHRVIQAVAAML